MTYPNEAEWLAYLMHLDDHRFFEVYRHYLGDFERPFNKPTLARRLLHFFVQDDVRANLLALLDAQERRMLTILKAYRPVLRGYIPSLWSYRLSSISSSEELQEVNELLQRLEKRLLAIPHRQGEATYWLPNPVVFTPEWEVALHPLQLCLGTPCAPAAPAGTTDFELVWLVILLTVAEAEPIGERRLLPRLKSRLPTFSEDADPIQDLLDLRLLDETSQSKSTALFVDWLEWDFLARKSPLERFLMLESEREPYPDSQIEAVCRLVEQLPRDRHFTAEEWSHIFLWVNVHDVTWQPWALALLDFYEMRQMTEPYRVADLPPTRSQARLIVSPNHDLILENPDLSAGLWLARCSRFSMADRVLTTRLDEKAFREYLERGGTAAELIQALEALSGSPLPQNVAFTLRHWEDTHHQVSVSRGVLVRLREPLLDVFRAHTSKLPEGVIELGGDSFFFPEEAWKTFRSRARNKPWSREPREPEAPRRSFWSLVHQVPAPVASQLAPPPNLDREPLERRAAALKQAIETFLSDKPNDLQAEAFRALVEARYVVDPSQFAHVWAQCEPKEAAGLNVQGKCTLIQEALDQGGRLLLIDYLRTKTDRQTYRAFPERLNSHKPTAHVWVRPVGTPFTIALEVAKILRVVSVKVDI